MGASVGVVMAFSPFSLHKVYAKQPWCRGHEELWPSGHGIPHVVVESSKVIPQ